MIKIKGSLLPSFLLLNLKIIISSIKLLYPPSSLLFIKLLLLFIVVLSRFYTSTLYSLRIIISL